LGHTLIRTISLHHALQANQIVASNLDIVEWLTVRCQLTPHLQPFSLTLPVVDAQLALASGQTSHNVVAHVFCVIRYRQGQTSNSIRC
jgi:hypothetical protein